MDLKDLIQAFAGLPETKRPIRLRLSQENRVLDDRITTEDGRTFEGRADAKGLTERFTIAIAFGQYTVEALDD